MLAYLSGPKTACGLARNPDRQTRGVKVLDYVEHFVLQTGIQEPERAKRATTGEAFLAFSVQLAVGLEPGRGLFELAAELNA